MTAQQMFAFVDTKRQLFHPFFEAAEARMITMLFEHLVDAGIESRPANDVEKVCRKIDEKLERLIVEWVLEEDEATLRSRLSSNSAFHH